MLDRWMSGHSDWAAVPLRLALGVIFFAHGAQLLLGLLPLLVPYPAEDMVAYPVSRRVNRPDHDGLECIEPVRDLEDNR